MTHDPGQVLFIFEMANNHMGSLDHGVRIIREVHAVSKDFPFRFGFKFQYRHLDTLIHPDYRGRTDLKYIKRFLETNLSEEHGRQLKDEAAGLGFVSVCTPFDEPSVERIERHGYDLVKIASCSLCDWPLLERIAESGKPVIASTAGAPLEDIDKVVSFFEHRQIELALLHCVAEYPTKDANLRLGQIDLLRRRYGNLRIGYSTHERPDNFDAVKLALAKGASILEKHVGLAAEGITLNAYSAGPAQVRRWLEAASQALAMCGDGRTRSAFAADELSSLRSLRRGLFARRRLAPGQRLTAAEVLLAMPAGPDQLTADSLSKYSELQATAEIAPGAALLTTNTRRRDVRQQIYMAVKRVKALLQTSGVVIPPKVDLEISHHYGIDRFDEFGLTMLTVVNRQYCKKVLVLLPGQRHPEQYHKIKEETFHVLYGDVWVNLDGLVRQCGKGDLVVIERGVRHSFGTAGGAILEEVSLTHRPGDSYYTDPAVAANGNRKTVLTYWLE
ncbi:MAG: N-acetylneuraminate synthase family protein [Thermoguttaceae bacterium]|jgi:sialic acid synthase SpsE/mannose-6-phosphate isomerase-like protein (cupin superfamily)